MKKLMMLALLVLSFNALADKTMDQIESVGEQRTVAVFIDLLEDGKEPSIDLFHEAIFTAEKSVNNFIKETSHNKTWLKGKMIPWLKLKSSGKTCYLSHDEVIETAIKEKLFNVHEVDRVLVFNHLDWSGECQKKNSFGFSTLGKMDFDTSEGPVRVSVAQFLATNRFVLPKLPIQPLSGITSSVIAHEFGHSLGLRGHANTLDCKEDAVNFDRAKCTQSAIADMFSLMGGEGFFRPSLHFAACHKADLGWINEKDKSLVDIKKGATPKKTIVKLRPYTTVGENVSVRINLESPIPVPCVNPANCNVNIASLYLEYRTARGFDENLSKLASDPVKFYDTLLFDSKYYGDSKVIEAEGVQVRGGFYKDNYCITSYNIDVTPESLLALNRVTNEAVTYSLYDNLDSFLHPGKTFSEPVNGLEISVKEIDKDGMAVVEILY